MTSKTIKTILFASLIAAMILPFSSMDFADAVVDTNKLTEKEQKKIPKSVKNYEVKSMKGIDIKDKIKNNQKLIIDYNGAKYDLKVWKQDLRKQDTPSYIYDENGNKSLVANEDVITYQGFVKGDADSRVFLAVTDDNISGFIYLLNDTITIEPIAFHDKTNSKNKQIVYSEKDLEYNFSHEGDVAEDVDLTPTVQTTSQSMLEQTLLPEANAVQKFANVITECDHAYYVLGSSNWQSRQLTIIGGMNTAYASTDASHNVVQMNCNNFSLSSSTISGVLTQLKNEWVSDPTSRNYVLGFIGTDKFGSTIGQAMAIGGICNPTTYGYTVFQTVDYPFGGYDGTLLEQKILASHESGHLLSGIHGDAATISGKKSIMYASTTNGNNILQFSAANISNINTTANACL